MPLMTIVEQLPFPEATSEKSVNVQPDAADTEGEPVEEAPEPPEAEAVEFAEDDGTAAEAVEDEAAAEAASTTADELVGAALEVVVCFFAHGVALTEPTASKAARAVSLELSILVNKNTTQKERLNQRVLKLRLKE